MASEYIASIIGDGAEQEIKSAIAQLDILAKRIVEIQGLIKEISRSNFTGNDKSASETIQQIDQVKKMQQEMAQMNQKVIALEGQLASARKRSTVALNDENKAIIEAQRNQDANIKTQLQLERAIEQLTKARQREEAEIAKQNSAYEQLKQEYAASAAATKELGTEYFNLQRSGTATAEQLREMGQAVRNASKETLGLHKGLFDIEQATGQSQRNVGNYNALMFETNQLLREAPNFALSARIGLMALSNNLPMFAEQFRKAANEIDDATGKAKGFKGALKDVGASIFSWETALIVGITLLLQYGDKIGGVSEAMKEQEERQKALNEAYDSGRNQAGAQVATIKELNDTMTNSNLSMSKRLDAYNKAVELYPSYLKQISKEDALNGGLADTINNKLIPAIINAAKARGMENKLTKLYEQELDLRDKLSSATDKEAKAIAKNDILWSEHGKTLQKVWDVTKGIATAGTVSSAASVADAQLETKKYRDAIIETKVAQEDVAKQLQEQLKLTGELDTSGNDRAAKDKNKAKRVTDTTNAEIKAMDELAEARARLNKAQIEADASANKAIADNEANILEQRLDAYDAYTQDKIKLYELESGLEITATQARLDKIAEIEAKAPAKRTAQEKKLLLQKESLSALLETLEKGHQLKLDQITDDAQKGRNAIIVSNIKQQKVIVQQEFNQTQEAIELQVNKQLSALNDSYNKGEISFKEYNDRRKKISADANQAIYDAESEMLNRMLAQATQSLTDSNITPEQKQAIQARINALYSVIAGLHPPKANEDGQTILEILGFGKMSIEDAKRLIAQKIQDLYSSIFQLIDAKRDAYYQKRSDQLDAEKEAIDANAQAEQDAINSSLLSETEKQQKLAQIQAEQQAKDNAIANQKKQLQRQQAQAEKQDAELQIVLNAAIAIAKTWSLWTNPVTIPLAISADALIAAGMAAQLAIVASKPLPQYATGTENHPGGLAVVGEKGTELVNLPSGQSFITPAVATVLDLPKHTEVIPHQDLLNKAHYDALNKVNMLNHSVSPNDYSQALIKSFEKGIGELKSTIKNKQETHFFWKNGELRKSVNRGGNWTHYVGGN